jgi:uncharacterized protein (TIGR00645 family)
MSRWFQMPIYLGLILGGLLYTYKFMEHLYHLCHDITSLTETEMMLGVLVLVDISMVANLLVVVIIGGYTTFVSKIDIEDHDDKPEWLEKVDAGTLKIKLAVSLVGVSGIHLLQTFIDIKDQPLEHVKYQIAIHLVFLASAIALAFAEKIQHSGEHH